MKYGQAISQLRDIHMPEPVGLFPLPVGWWIAVGLLVCLVVGGYYFTLRYLRRMQRSTLQELNQLEQRYHEKSAQDRGLSDINSNSIAAELSMILKRFAQAQFPKNPVMEFNGESWLLFLDRTGGKGEFRYGVGRNLLVWPYREIEDEALMDLLTLSKLWVSRNYHRRWRRALL